MKKILTKIGLSLLGILIGLSPLLLALPVQASMAFELYHADGGYQTYGPGADNVVGQTFTPVYGHYIQNVVLRLARTVELSGGSCVMQLRNVNETHIPTGTALATASIPYSTITTNETAGGYYNFIFSPPSVHLTNGTEYGFTFTSPRNDITGTALYTYGGNGYLNGVGIYKTEATGNEWVYSEGLDLYFEEWGEPAYVTPTPTPTGTPPAVTTVAPTHIDEGAAALNGYLSSKGTASSVAVGFDFGIGSLGYIGSTYYPAYGSPVNATGTFTLTMIGLSSGTEYWYRAKATGDGATNGLWTSFTHYTGGEETATPSTVLVLPETDITNTTVTLNANLTSIGTYAPIFGAFQLLKNGIFYNSYPQNVTATGTYSENVTGLEPGTNYSYSFRVWDADPYLSLPEPERSLHFAISGSRSFKTTGVSTASLGVDTVQVLSDDVNNTAHTANLKGYLIGMGNNTSVHVYFNVGIGEQGTPGYSYTTPGQNVTEMNYFNEPVGGTSAFTLLVNKQYHYRAVATANGTIAFGEDMEFNTFGTVPTPPPTTTPSGGGDLLPPPEGWGTVGWHYLLLIAAMLCVPFCMMYIIGGKFGQFLSILIDAVIFVAALANGWIEIYGIILCCLAAGGTVWQILRPKGA